MSDFKDFDAGVRFGVMSGFIAGVMFAVAAVIVLATIRGCAP